MKAQKQSRLQRLLAFIDSLIFPSGVTCICCRRALGEDERDGLCPSCVQALKKLAEKQAASDPDGMRETAQGLDGVMAAFPYESQARSLILILKFGGIREAAVPLCKAMSAIRLPHADMLVPVPTSKRRQRERGFNQAALLAQGVAVRKGIPCTEALERISERGKQSLLSAAARRKNLVGSMRADGRVAGKYVVLVDDIYTTGSTAQEAARALREAGAAGVFALCAARSHFGGKPARADFDRLRGMMHKTDKQRGKL